MPDISVIVLSWNTRDLLAACLSSILSTAGDLDIETVVVDNASSDGSQEMVAQRFPQVRLIANADNLGFARANNEAMSVCQGRYALLFNSDAVATPGAFQALFELAEAQPRAGIVGAQLRNPDGSFQAAYTPFPSLSQELLILTGLGRLFRGPWYPSRKAGEGEGPRRVDYVEGACMLVRRQAVEEVGGLDEGYFMYSEEVDWCYTMRQAGWEVWYQPEARIIHHGGGSSRHRKPQQEADLYRSRVCFFRKHYGALATVELKALMYSLTAVKIVYHHAMRAISQGRRGRPVVGMSDLIASLRDA